MKRLLCWSICLWVVSSPPVVAGGWWSVAGTNTFGGMSRSTQAQEAVPANHQPPATSHLPCTDSSPTCLNALGDLAVQNGREIAVVKQADCLAKENAVDQLAASGGVESVGGGLAHCS